MKLLSSNKPSEGELEILQILWKKEAATVREVYEEISLNKECAYTTTLKLMQIMFDKQLVVRDNSQKTHIYKPNVSKEKTQKLMLGKMVNSLFAGSTSQLILQALGSEKPSDAELEQIQDMLDKLKSE
ncbi:BlaI/MecI/CopY family transcriptional regulator [Rhizosphaericola mali]|uniref:BlaI/MecI/CopY family transcriptional regulator n=1 Tax=Rhizosphaericola mali TaxID=2545455 RepID=A0A5P2FW62_9BACT|nr:BlaI/MecI/CopY family transcriptional regulator [Rhizosphaericola mali]QES87405.1 BlaI/MecI/CopY family transcriptional regulator [Rhizosphaericola mali]